MYSGLRTSHDEAVLLDTIRTRSEGFSHMLKLPRRGQHLQLVGSCSRGFPTTTRSTQGKCAKQPLVGSCNRGFPTTTRSLRVEACLNCRCEAVEFRRVPSCLTRYARVQRAHVTWVELPRRGQHLQLVGSRNRGFPTTMSSNKERVRSSCSQVRVGFRRRRDELRRVSGMLECLLKN